MPLFFKSSRTKRCPDLCDVEHAALVRPKSKPRSHGACILLVGLALGNLAVQPAPAQQPANSSAPPPQDSVTAPPSISLSPAVIMAKGVFGQGLTQELTLTNQTGRDFAFELVAEDVVIKDGKRVFVPAGGTANTIAATAVVFLKTGLVEQI